MTMNWTQLLCEDRIRKTTRQKQETRGEIHRDYGRVVFATPVRRLQDKAQVFPLEPIDAVRTRLTHSMEVSSVARGLAHVIAQELTRNRRITAEQAYDIETIAATCGLVHDLGNPPFGHAGEIAIADWFKQHKNGFWDFDQTTGKRLQRDLINFEGNAQTLRLLTKLQILSDRKGLNLTCATLSAAIKYTANSLDIPDKKDGASPPNKPTSQSKKKLGFFTSEEPVVQEVREKTGTGEARNPITFLVEASDDMVYSVVNVEDAIKKGVISWRDVRDILHDTRDKYGRKLYNDCVVKAEKRISAADIPIRGRSWDEAVSQYFRTLVIVHAQAAVREVFFRNYEGIMSGSYDKEILYDSALGPLYKVLKQEIGGKRIYTAKGTLRLETLGRNVIYFLLDTFWGCEHSQDTKTFPQKLYHLLSQNYRTVFENPTKDDLKLPTEYRKALLVTDYICGMTDTFALNFRRELQHG